VFKRVTIVGVGLLGASLGLALKQRRLAQRVVGVGRKGSPSLETALARGAIDEMFFDIAKAAADSDLVVLCTPIRQFPGMLQQIAPVLRAGTIVTDVGSTKAEVMRWAAQWLPAKADGPVFIGSHPMAGSEKRGPENARGDLYQGAVCLLCSDSAQPVVTAALEKIERLWQAVGLRTLRLDPQEHDRWVATISHLPHAVAFSLVNAAAREPEMLQAVAGGFIDTTRVASSDLEMWTDIFLTNREAVVAAIERFTGDLAALKGAIAAGDEAAIRGTLSRAGKTREELLARRETAAKPGEKSS